MKINLGKFVTPKEAHFDNPEGKYPLRETEEKSLVENLRLREAKGEVTREETDDALTFREKGKVVFHKDKKAIGEIVETERALHEAMERSQKEQVGRPYHKDSGDVLLESLPGEETGKGN